MLAVDWQYSTSMQIANLHELEFAVIYGGRVTQDRSSKIVYQHTCKQTLSVPLQILINNEFIGVNFIDTYFRTGLYKRELPTGLGEEGAGTVEAVGEGEQSACCNHR